MFKHGHLAEDIMAAYLRMIFYLGKNIFVKLILHLLNTVLCKYIDVHTNFRFVLKLWQDVAFLTIGLQNADLQRALTQYQLNHSNHPYNLKKSRKCSYIR